MQAWRLDFAARRFFFRICTETSFGRATLQIGICSRNFQENPMKSFKTAVSNFVSNEDGAALVEYALLVALIAIICILGVTTLGTKINGKFTAIGGSL